MAETDTLAKGFNSLRRVQRRGKHSSKTALSHSPPPSPPPKAPDPSATNAASASNIRHTHNILCQKIVSYKIGLSEVANGDTGEAAIPKYLNVLLSEIQQGIQTLNQDLSHLVAEGDTLTEKETRQLYGLICDLERQLQLCRRQKRAAVRSARQRIQTAKLRAAAASGIPEIVPEKVEGTDGLLAGDAEDVDVKVEIENEAVKHVDNSTQVSLPDLKEPTPVEDAKSIDLDVSLNSLPTLDKPESKTKVLHPPIRFTRQQSNMGYPFASCFPVLPAAPKNRMPSTSSIPKQTFLRDQTMFPREPTVSPRERTVFQRDRAVFPRERTVFQRDRTVFPRERTMFPRQQAVFPNSPRDRYSRHLSRGKTKLF